MFGSKTTTTRTSLPRSTTTSRRSRCSPFTSSTRSRRSSVKLANSNAGLKGAINNPRVSSAGAKSAKEQLKLNHVPKRDIPRRRLSTMLERIGVKLGLKGKHSRAGYTGTY